MKIDQVTYQPPFLQRNRPATRSPQVKPGTDVERADFHLPGNTEASKPAAPQRLEPGDENREIVSSQMAPYLSDEEKKFLHSVLREGGAEYGASAYDHVRKAGNEVGTRLDLKG